jgi:hypothetical protein
MEILSSSSRKTWVVMTKITYCLPYSKFNVTRGKFTKLMVIYETLLSLILAVRLSICCKVCPIRENTSFGLRNVLYTDFWNSLKYRLLAFQCGRKNSCTALILCGNSLKYFLRCNLRILRQNFKELTDTKIFWSLNPFGLQYRPGVKTCFSILFLPGNKGGTRKSSIVFYIYLLYDIDFTEDFTNFRFHFSMTLNKWIIV